MINKIHKIAIITDDIEGAIKFYTETLDLEVIERFPAPDDEDYVFLKAGDMILELMPQKTMGLPSGFHHISFKVDDMDASTQALADNGVDMTVEPFNPGVEGLTLAFFDGPNGVPLQLFNRK